MRSVPEGARGRRQEEAGGPGAGELGRQGKKEEEDKQTLEVSGRIWVFPAVGQWDTLNVCGTE